ncbi:ankyrin repeat domain-containing protein [Wolbachia endosymbiont of Ctenocephalides felis wCfeJ]|uniref:ankyrin repeat domain-containing protein n=1 Tax=Wolbachia endosymbiont of Ctenocephalides felis wCfeJ TaxID=2732594 RepID=UPI001448A242|nr:ankyrin repeat domain-containing protein [Wolbachia endosymbiont of Ctenocephalides felis wCfeJ]WCR57689.1 MAG: Phosphocholine transferase AnkX [Wolbachia endosymbiont of Ctenocephalides felis wCfeJ]
MALTLEQWEEILNAVEFNNNPGDVLEQVKAKLKEQYFDTYKEWEQGGFNVNHLFNIRDGQICLEHTLLHIAALNGHLDIIKCLVEQKNVDVNQVDNDGLTVLHVAAENGRLGIVKHLVEQKNVDVNQVDNDGLTALHWAASNGYLDTVEYLVEQKNVDVNQIDNYGDTALHWAAQYGHLGTVKYLIEQKNVDVNQVDNDSYTALHWAALNGYLDTVKYLVEQRNVDINQVDNDGETALHVAASNGHLDIVKYLVEQRDVNIDQANNNGKTALHFAAQFDELDVAEFLIAHEIKLKGSEVRKPDYLTEHREISEYWDKCLDEVKKMKEEKVGGNITFYSILVSKSIDKLEYYMRNEQFTKVLERSNYRNKFPIYANDLDYLFKKAKQRVEALNIGEIVIKHFDGLSKGGPAHLYIAEYLSDEDLKNLRKAAIQTIDEEDISKSLGSDVRVEHAAKKQGMQM